MIWLSDVRDAQITTSISAKDTYINPILVRMRTLWWISSLAYFVSFVNVGYGYGCISQWCDTCLSAKVHDAPGVGFDLTPLYG